VGYLTRAPAGASRSGNERTKDSVSETGCRLTFE
jgi:hypothetical protein